MDSYLDEETGFYICGYCGREYDDEDEAETCCEDLVDEEEEDSDDE